MYDSYRSTVIYQFRCLSQFHMEDLLVAQTDGKIPSKCYVRIKRLFN